MFVERNESGRIFAAYTTLPPGKKLEFLAEDDAELLKFLNEKPGDWQ